MKRIKFFGINNIALVGLVLVLIVGGFSNSSFLGVENLTNLLRSSSIVGLVAIGMTFVILCGSIDLSVGSVFALSGYFFIVFSKHSWILALLIPLAMGIAIGYLNGVLVSKMHIPAFVGTLATMMLVRSLVLLLTNEATVSAGRLPSFLKYLGRGDIFGILPMPLLFFLLCCLFFSFVLNKRPIGRAMYIVGGNSEAATMMGVSVSRTLIIAHIICGFMASLGGIFFASRIGCAQALAGKGYEMFAIASVVIGGAQLNGGVGKISGTLIGAIIMGSFTNIFSMQHVVSPVWQNAVIGTILLVIILMQSIMASSPDRFEKRKNIRLA